MEKLNISELKNKLKIKVNMSPVLLLFNIFYIMLFLDIVFLVLFSMLDFMYIETSWYLKVFSFEEILFMLFMLFHLFLFIFFFIKWFFNYFVIEKWEITHKYGILFRIESSFAINEFDSISLYQSILWRIFNYWDINLFYNEKKIVLKNVPDPSEFINFINIFKIKE